MKVRGVVSGLIVLLAMISMVTMVTMVSGVTSVIEDGDRGPELTQDANPADPPIRNFLRINEEFCTGGQPKVEHYEGLKARGVKVVINLRHPGEHRADEERELVEKLGMRYINIPVVYREPQDEQATEFLRVTDDRVNRPAFIHCTAAIRVGAFWMIRRVLRDGWTVEKAEEEARSVGLREAPHMLEFAKNYIGKHKNGATEKR